MDSITSLQCRYALFPSEFEIHLGPYTDSMFLLVLYVCMGVVFILMRIDTYMRRYQKHGYKCSP